MNEKKCKQIQLEDEAKKAMLEAFDDQNIDIVAFVDRLRVSGFCFCPSTNRIEVKNLDDHFQEVSVSTTCNGAGDDSFFSIENQQTEKWGGRCVGHKVTIKLNGGNSIKFTVGTNNDFIVDGGELK